MSSICAEENQKHQIEINFLVRILVPKPGSLNVETQINSNTQSTKLENICFDFSSI